MYQVTSVADPDPHQSEKVEYLEGHFWGIGAFEL
jgi:hypothetical protein